MRNGNAKIIFLLMLILSACGKPLPEFENMDLDVWKADRNGCRRDREKMIFALKEQKDKLKGLSEDDIIKLLGRPDQNELWKRNQKFFNYFLSPSKSCGSDSLEVKLSIRFNAMSLAKEVEVEEPEISFTDEDYKGTVDLLRDTVIGGIGLDFQRLTPAQFDSLHLLTTNGKMPLEKFEKALIKDNCMFIELADKSIDTLCNKKEESGYHEDYEIKGLWKDHNLLLVNFRNWEESDDFFLKLSKRYHYGLNSQYEMSPDLRFILGYSAPYFTSTFSLSQIKPDSVQTLFYFELDRKTITQADWLKENQCLLAVNPVKGVALDYSQYFLVTFKRLN